MTQLASLPASSAQQAIVNKDGTATPAFWRILVGIVTALNNAKLNMQTTVNQFFAPTLLTNATAVIGTNTSSGNPQFLLSKVRFTNLTGGAITVTAYAVPDGGSPSDTGNAFLLAKSIAANDFLDVDVPILAANETFRAKASANTSIIVTCLDATTFS